jgi:hypothetical protein
MWPGQKTPEYALLPPTVCSLSCRCQHRLTSNEAEEDSITRPMFARRRSGRRTYSAEKTEGGGLFGTLTAFSHAKGLADLPSSGADVPAGPAAPTTGFAAPRTDWAGGDLAELRAMPDAVVVS